jgi:hypothetical protein
VHAPGRREAVYRHRRWAQDGDPDLPAKTGTGEVVALRGLPQAAGEAVGSDALKAVGGRRNLQPIQALQLMRIGPQALPKPGG